MLAQSRTNTVVMLKKKRNMKMKMRSTAILFAVGCLVALPSAAMAEPIHGWDKAAIEATLATQGISFDKIEEWGPYIRVFASDAAGTSIMHLVDPDTWDDRLN